MDRETPNDNDDLDADQACLASFSLVILRILVLALNLSLLLQALWVWESTELLKNNYAFHYRSSALGDGKDFRKSSALVPFRAPIESSHGEQIFGDLFSPGSVSTEVGCVTTALGAAFNALYVLKYYRAAAVLSIILFMAGFEYFTLGTAVCSKKGQKCFQDIKEKMMSVLRSKYSMAPDNPSTSFFNRMMIKHDCCGVNGPLDFWNITLNVTISEDDHHDHEPHSHAHDLAHVEYKGRLILPPACCKDDIFYEDDITKRFRDVLRCANDKYWDHINKQGCFDAFMNLKLDSSVFQTFYTIRKVTVVMLTALIHVIIVRQEANKILEMGKVEEDYIGEAEPQSLLDQQTHTQEESQGLKYAEEFSSCSSVTERSIQDTSTADGQSGVDDSDSDSSDEVSD